MRVPGIAAALLLSGFAADAAAHDTWIGPVSAPTRAGATVAVRLTSGGAFPAPEAAPAADRVARATARLAGTSSRLPAPAVEAKTTRFQVHLAAPGIAAIAVALKPRRLELAPDLIHEYLEEIDALESAGALWARRPDPKTWIEVYEKHAKTFVRVGEPSGDDSWKEPVGLVLEILPEKDPTTLSAGGELAIRVLKNGTPLPGLALRAERGPKGTPPLKRRTDASGRAVFPLDREGPWLLAGTELRAAADGATWESDFTTLTFLVAPGGAGP